MARISYWHGVVVGVLATVGYLLWKLGVPPSDAFDAFIVILLCIVVGFGGIVGGGIVLAWRHVLHNARVLRPTTAILLILSLPSLTCYAREKQQTPTFLARADSVRGVVMGRNVFGEQGIVFAADSGYKERLVASKKVAHRQFQAGDGIWVYRERLPPHRVDVWPPGPDLRITLGRLLWVWGIGGVLIAGYGPLFRQQPSRAERPAD
jgi:hypothetical protein